VGFDDDDDSTISVLVDFVLVVSCCKMFSSGAAAVGVKSYVAV